MIKASLTYHDPLDLYDYFRAEFGNLSMVIKGNLAIMTFQNPSAKKFILDNPRRVIKGLPITVRPFEDDEPSRLQNRQASRRLLNPNQMEIQEPSNNEEDLLTLGNTIALPNVYHFLKLIGTHYEKKIQELKNQYQDHQICNAKINQFHTFLDKRISMKKNQILQPLKKLKFDIKNYCPNPESHPIQLDPVFTPLNQNLPVVSRRFSNVAGSSEFVEGLSYASHDLGSVKRLCLLNEQNFVTTVKLDKKNQEKGQLRIYNRENHVPQYSLDIHQIPYSLMMHENFILAGDFQGHIHFVDIKNNNRAQFSSKLSPGLIFQMQKYDTNSALPSILTLISGVREEYKLKLFEIEKESVGYDGTESLYFHPKDEILCEGTTMTMEVMDSGRFAYGSARNTYIYSSFDKYGRDYIMHDQNVMKIKKRNSNELVEALQRKITILDLRTSKLKNQIFDFKMDLNTIELLSENQIFYGGMAGEVGLIDCRKPKAHVWTPQTVNHQGKIADILKIGPDVITGDSTGGIIQWKGQSLK